MTVNKPYQELEIVAACLRQDGLEDIAEELLNAHKGIFSSLELYYEWRFHLSKILQLKSISDNTCIEARRVYELIDKELH